MWRLVKEGFEREGNKSLALDLEILSGYEFQTRRFTNDLAVSMFAIQGATSFTKGELTSHEKLSRVSMTCGTAYRAGILQEKLVLQDENLEKQISLDRRLFGCWVLYRAHYSR